LFSRPAGWVPAEFFCIDFTEYVSLHGGTMKIGLFGLPKSGKTTLFNALTKSEAPVSAYASSKAEPNIAIVKVSDERVKRLSEMYKPKKTVFATKKLWMLQDRGGLDSSGGLRG
jgi:tRNA U34 5-carboxymethylaminomethyl modifying GTPase MnmE/TrmE